MVLCVACCLSNYRLCYNSCGMYYGKLQMMSFGSPGTKWSAVKLYSVLPAQTTIKCKQEYKLCEYIERFWIKNLHFFVVVVVVLRLLSSSSRSPDDKFCSWLFSGSGGDGQLKRFPLHRPAHSAGQQWEDTSTFWVRWFFQRILRVPSFLVLWC